MPMWINMEEYRRFPDRTKMVTITQMDLVKANNPKGFLNMGTVLDVWTSQKAVYNGVRIALADLFPSSVDWVIVGVRFRMEMYRLEVMVEHPSFDPVPLGQVPPEIHPEEEGVSA